MNDLRGFLEPANGANFYLDTPYFKPKTNRFLVNDSKKSVGRLKDVNILIAEDDANSMYLLKRMLELESANLFFANDGLMALDMVKATPQLQIVLMDLKMPVMDGFTSAKMIKQIRPELCIIAQSAYAFTGDENNARKSGCDDYIRKPIKMESLLEIIIKHISIQMMETVR